MEPAAFRLVAQCLDQLRHRLFDIYYHDHTKCVTLMLSVWLEQKPLGFSGLKKRMEKLVVYRPRT